MRIALVLVLVACGAPVAPRPAVVHDPAASPRATRVTAGQAGAGDEPTARLDPIRGLAPPASEAEVAWVTPAQARLELAASPIDAAPANAPPIAVTILDAQGSLVRLAVRLDHARFSLWMDRAWLYGVIARETPVPVDGAQPNATTPALFPGARVKRLAHRAGETRVRYVGALEVEGWIPDAALTTHGIERGYTGRMPTGRQTLSVLPGSIIRSAPSSRAAPFALVVDAYVLDIVQPLDATWVQVAYRDGDVGVTGFYERFSPPGLVHRERVAADAQPMPVATNAVVASGTCLYARAGGEPIGYVVGDRKVALDPSTRGWWTLALDTPWGPVAFAARGPTEHELAPCAPDGAVPPTAISAP